MSHPATQDTSAAEGAGEGDGEGHGVEEIPELAADPPSPEGSAQAAGDIGAGEPALILTVMPQLP